MDSAESAKEAKETVRKIGFWGGIATSIAIFGLFLAVGSMQYSYMVDVRSFHTESRSATSSLESTLNAERIARKKIEAEIRELKDGISKLCSILENKEQKRACLSIDIKP